MSDKVNHPSHYTQGGIECIEAIKASMSHEEYCGYLKGNTLKYLWRYKAKNGLEDLEKAKVYLGWLIAEQGEKPVIDQFGKSVSEIYREVDDGRYAE